ncbi:MAG TPA: TonB-dependent receptor [Polyangiales bacterium]|nr:TonB-dependent receptor [Polyangiales bacterium]
MGKAKARLGRAAVVGLSLLLWAAALPLADAQPKLPDPGKLPTTPDVPALPIDPPKAAAAAEADSAAESGGVPSAPQGPSAIVDGPLREVEIQIDDKQRTPSDGLPASLPKALRQRARPHSTDEQAAGGLTIEEIVNPPVSSVSNSVEGALRAPAWTIILTRRDLIDRGYTDLSQILDDLPGMDVARTYGVDYVRAYARGYRSDVGKDPYLILIDGQPYPSIFFGDSQILTAFPLSNVAHVEIVYGPASVVHGENAATGLINIVTNDGLARQQQKDFGTRGQVFMTYGGAQRNLTRFADTTKIVDATASWVNELWRISVTARMEHSTLDRSIGESFEFTKNRYQTDAALWGQSVLDQFPDRAGQFRSANDKLALDARIAFGTLELGGSLFSHASGNGTEYAGDRYQVQGSWSAQERSLWLRNVARPLPMLTSTSLLRYRQSDIAPSSFFLWRAPATETRPAGTVLENQTVSNSSFHFQQQMDINAGKDLIVRGDDLKLTVGLSLKALQVSNELESPISVLYPDGDVTMPQPSRSAEDAPTSTGRHSAEEAGVFLLGHYALSAEHALHLGARLQHQNDEYFALRRTPLVLNASYVGTLGPVTVKALYGEAAVAPSPYELSSAMSHLSNATTRNLELNATATLGPASLTLAGFRVDYKKPIVFNTTGDNALAFNADSASATGLDAAARLFIKPVQVWLYYSRYFQNEVRVVASDKDHSIGDLARDKLWAGVTFDQSRFSATLLGRFVGNRDTVPTNPVRHVPWYVSLDANLLFKDVVFEGASVALRCTNLLDARYNHPGIGAADSGIDSSMPSKGDLNSLLPQPRRSFYLSFMLDL